MNNTFLKIAVIGLIITNIVVVYKLNALQAKADEAMTKIDPTIQEANDIANKIKSILG